MLSVFLPLTTRDTTKYVVVVEKFWAWSVKHGVSLYWWLHQQFHPGYTLTTKQHKSSAIRRQTEPISHQK